MPYEHYDDRGGNAGAGLEELHRKMTTIHILVVKVPAGR